MIYPILCHELVPHFTKLHCTLWHGSLMFHCHWQKCSIPLLLNLILIIADYYYCYS